MKPTNRVIRLLWMSTLAMLAGLASLIALVHSANVHINAMNRVIAEDTAPGIVALQRMGVHLGELRSLLREHLKAPGDPSVARTAFATSRAAAEENLMVYLALPIDPGEPEVMDELRVRLQRLDEVASRVLATGRETPLRARDELRADLDAAANEADRTVMRATDLNAELTTASMRALHDVAQRLLPWAVALEAGSAIAAIIAMGAAYRVSRQEAALGERRFLEQKNAELEAFSGRVAHDLLSPLMTVSLAVGLAEQRLAVAGDERLHGVLSRAASSLQRVRRLVSDLLDFARAAAKPLPGATTAVAPLLHSLVEDFESRASETGVMLRLTSASLRTVPCAQGILSSILLNLVENAIRHTGEKTEVERRVDVRAVDVGPEVRFEVEDTGPGIAPEDHEAIFEPYVRRSVGGAGLGLGLATVKRLAEAHGGHVGVESEVGHGALFWVTLPTAA